MFKRLFLISTLALSMVALSSNASWGRISFPSGWGGGGLSVKCYNLWAVVVGGGQLDPDKIALMSGDLDVEVGYTKCLNPGSGAFDIDPGEGDTKLSGATVIDVDALQKFGKQTPEVRFPNTVPEFAELLYWIFTQCDAAEDAGEPLPAFCFNNPGIPQDQPVFKNFWKTYVNCDINGMNFPEQYLELVADCPSSVTALKNVYGVDESDCRNRNWRLYAYIIESTYNTAATYRNCTTTFDPDWIQVPPYSCEYKDDTVDFFCSTDTPFAEPPFDFACTLPPVAVPDPSYTTNKNTKLVADGDPVEENPPGVLDNDYDPEGATLTAILVEGPVGRLTLNSDGTFTYNPKRGFIGQDTFLYKANDGLADSSAVEVTIDVQAP
jgi:hypothetical protein